MRLQSHAALLLIPLAPSHQLVSDDANAGVLRLLHLVATLHRRLIPDGYTQQRPLRLQRIHLTLQ